MSINVKARHTPLTMHADMHSRQLCMWGVRGVSVHVQMCAYAGTYAHAHLFVLEGEDTVAYVSPSA